MKRVKIKDMVIPTDTYTMITLVKPNDTSDKATLYIDGVEIGYVRNYKKSILWLFQHYNFQGLTSVSLPAEVFESMSFNGWVNGGNISMLKAWSRPLTLELVSEVTLIHSLEKEQLRIIELEKEVESLLEYKDMYEGLCK